MSDISVKFSGPLFDGQAEQLIREGTEAIRHRVAAEAQKLTVAAFASALHHETSGRFLSSITATDTSRTYTTIGGHTAYSLPVVVADIATETVVATDLATYGPWLAGFGSRNQTTRFKGYNGFRRAAQQLETRVQELSDQAFRPYAEAVNG